MQIAFQEICEGKEKPEEALQRDAELRKRHTHTNTWIRSQHICCETGKTCIIARVKTIWEGVLRGLSGRQDLQ